MILGRFDLRLVLLQGFDVVTVGPHVRAEITLDLGNLRVRPLSPAIVEATAPCNRWGWIDSNGELLFWTELPSGPMGPGNSLRLDPL